MRIIFDGRMLGEDFGIGVYSLELLDRMCRQGSGHEWIVFVRPQTYHLAESRIKRDLPNVQLISTDIRHYSYAEQLKLPFIIRKHNPDLVHFPNFNVPLFYRGNFITTVHDMVHHRLPGHRRGAWYRRLAYKRVIDHAVEGASTVVTVSESSKKDITHFYPSINHDKVRVVHEGVSPRYNDLAKDDDGSVLKKYGIGKRYLLFVGVWEVKKNLPFIARVFKQLADIDPDLSLVLAGKEDPWHPEVRGQIQTASGKYWSRVITPGFVESEDLPALYRQAAVFVNPSPLEGFGLPGVEAMRCGTPVAVADSEVFREVYGEAAAYFNPADVSSATSVVSGILLNKAKQADLIKLGRAKSATYTWEEAARKTIRIYEQSI